MTTLPPRIAALLCSLPGMSFPRTIEKVDKLISDGVAPTPVITSVITSDPLYTAVVLGQANVSGSELTQPSQAIRQLGLSMVQGLTRSLLPMPQERHQLMAGYWSEANACGAMTRVVTGFRPAIFLASIDDETAHVAGLLHDLGMIFAGMHFPEAYNRAVERLMAGERSLPKLIADELGAAPTALAAQIAHLWQLPDLVTVVATHHQKHPARAPQFRDVCCAVHIARMLVRGCGYCPDQDCLVEPLDEEAMEILNLELTDIPRLLELFFDEMEDLELYEPNLTKP